MACTAEAEVLFEQQVCVRCKAWSISGDTLYTRFYDYCNCCQLFFVGMWGQVCALQQTDMKAYQLHTSKSFFIAEEFAPAGETYMLPPPPPVWGLEALCVLTQYNRTKYVRTTHMKDWTFI